MFLAPLRWWRRLDRGRLLQALPALVCGVGCVTVLLLCLGTPSQHVEAVYLDRARNAVQAKNHAEALVCFERLTCLYPEREDILYEAALAAETAGNSERAAGIMSQLAPLDRQGYGNAHSWQARRLLTAAGEPLPRRQAAESHLLRALEAGADNKEALHAALGELYLSKGRVDEAEQHLLAAAKILPQVRLQLARLHAFKGDRDQARSEAAIVVKLFGNWAKSDLFAHQARLKWAEATTFLEDFPRAVAILHEGWTGTGEPLYKRALAQVHAAWFDYLRRAPDSNPGLRLTVLEKGLQWDPKNMVLLDRLLDAVKIRRDAAVSPNIAAALVSVGGSPIAGGFPAASTYLVYLEADADRARSLLRMLLAKGEASAHVHFALGVDAWERGKIDAAKLHWERANEIAPDMPTIANNLAWLLYQTSTADLNRALHLMNLAIAQAPAETNFRDTRGRIHAKLGKWREALADLEAALVNSPNSLDLHRTLAEVYEHLNVPDMAAEHRRLAQGKNRR